MVETVAYCKIPERFFNQLVEKNCTAKLVDDGGFEVYNKDTNEKLFTFIEEPFTNAGEMTIVNDGKIDQSIEINKFVRIDIKTFGRQPIPMKSVSAKRKEKTLYEEIPKSKFDEPVVLVSDIQDTMLLRAKIESTIEKVQGLPDEEDQIGCVKELLSFVKKEIKQLSGLDPEIIELIQMLNVRKKKDVILQALSSIMYKI